MENGIITGSLWQAVDRRAHVTEITKEILPLVSAATLSEISSNLVRRDVMETAEKVASRVNFPFEPSSPAGTPDTSAKVAVEPSNMTKGAKMRAEKAARERVAAMREKALLRGAIEDDPCRIS